MSEERTVNKKFSIKKNMLIFGVGVFFTKILNLLFSPLYSYYMTASEFGVVDILLTSCNLLIPVFTLAITEALIKYGIDDNADKKTIFSTSLLVTLVGMVVMAFTVFGISRFVYKEYAFLTLIYYCSECLFLFLQAFSKSLKRTTDYVISSVIYSSISLSLIAVLLVARNLGVEGYLIGLIVGTIVATIYLLFRCQIWKYFSFKSVKRSTLKTMVAFSIPLVFSGISYWLISGSDKYITKYFLGDGDVGLLSVIHKIPSLCTVLYSIFNYAFVLSALKDHKLTTETYDEDVKFYSQIFEFIISLLSIGSIFITVLSLPIILLYSKDFYSCWIFIPMYTFGVILGALRNFYASIYMTREKTLKIMICVFFGALLNVVICYTLMKFANMGLLATAISTVVANAFIFIFFYFDVKKIINLKLSIREGLSLVLCLVATIFSLCQLNIIIFYVIEIIILFFIILLNLKNIKSICKLVIKK